jgi:hypothetical protein
MGKPTFFFETVIQMAISIATGAQHLQTLRAANIIGYNDILQMFAPSMSLGPSNAAVLKMDSAVTGFDLTVTGSTKVTGAIQQVGNAVQKGSTVTENITAAERLAICFQGASVSGSSLTSTGKFDVFADTAGSANRLSIKPTGATDPVASFCDDGRAWFTGLVRGDAGAAYQGTVAGNTVVAAQTLSVGVTSSVVSGSVVMPDKWDITADSQALNFIHGGTTYFQVTSSGTGSTQLSAGLLKTDEVRRLGDSQLLINGDSQNVVVDAPIMAAKHAIVATDVKTTNAVSIMSGATVASDGALTETTNTTWKLTNASVGNEFKASYGGTDLFGVSTSGVVTAKAANGGFVGKDATVDRVLAKTSDLLLSASNFEVQASGFLATNAPVYANSGIFLPKSNAFQSDQTGADTYKIMSSASALSIGDTAHPTYLQLTTDTDGGLLKMTGNADVTGRLVVPVVGDATKALVLKGTTVTIDADQFNVKNGINQVNTTVLDVEDINITLGHNGVGAPEGAVGARDGAGIIVAGDVANLPTGESQATYEPFFKWFNNSGVFASDSTLIDVHNRPSWMINGDNLTLKGVGGASTKFIWAVDGDSLKLFKKDSSNVVTLVTSFA